MKKPSKHRAQRQSRLNAEFRKHPALALAAARHRSWIDRPRELTRRLYRPNPIEAAAVIALASHIFGGGRGGGEDG